MLGVEVGDVLDEGDDDRGGRGKQRADHAVALAADGVVVEAVGGDGACDVVGEEQQHIGQVAQDRRLEGLDGQRPDAEVREEEVVLHEDEAVGDGHDDQGQQRAQTQLLPADLHAARGEVHAVGLAVEAVEDEHAEDGEQAAAGGPEAEPHGLALRDGHREAPREHREIDQAAESRAGRQREPEPELALPVREDGGLGRGLGAQGSEGRREDQKRCKGAEEEREADHAHEVEGFLPLPDLIGRRDGIGRAEGLGEEVADVGLGAGGEVGPGVGDGRTVDDAQGLFAVHILAVLGEFPAELGLGGIAAEVQKGLGRGALHEVRGVQGLAVGADGGAEELVVHGGDHGDVAAAVGIGIAAVVVLIERVVAVDQDRGDQGRLVEVVRLHRGVHGPAAHRVAGHADAGAVDEGHAAQGQNALIHAVGGEDEEVRRDLGVAVVRLVDREDDEAAARELHIVGVGHLLVVEVAVAGDDGRGGVVGRGRPRYEQVGGHRVAAVRLDVQLLHDDLSSGGLHGADHDAAQQHQDQRNAEDDLCGFLDFFHGSLSSLKYGKPIWVASSIEQILSNGKYLYSTKMHIVFCES